MFLDRNYKRLEYWMEECQSKGKLAFSLNELRQQFPHDSETALKQLLERLAAQKKILSVFKGYYIIVPAQYSSKGILPPAMFIAGLMEFLERKYYVGLLSAAALHGAAHQQPQAYFVVTEYPVLRPTNKKGIKINYISTKQLPPEVLLDKKNTETGYVYLSNPLLTAIDLITYEKKIGGLNRAATVINELLEGVKRNEVNDAFIKYASVSSLQRLGYILDEVLNKKMLADILLARCRKADLKFYPIPLKASGKKSKDIINDKWKLIINTEIEID